MPSLHVYDRTPWNRSSRRRGQGVGRALLRAVADTARQAGVDRISLSVERANPAVSLYRSEGYVVLASGEHSDTMVLDLQQR